MEYNMIFWMGFGIVFLICILGMILLAIRETNRYNKSIEAEAEFIGQLLIISAIAITKFIKIKTNMTPKYFWKNERIYIKDKEPINPIL